MLKRFARSIWIIAIGVFGVAAPTFGDSTTLVDQISAQPDSELVNLDYDSRLALMKNYAGPNGGGYISSVGFERRGYGLWGATDILTQWQYKTGRNRDPHWRVPNAEISVIPSVYLREYQRDPTLPCARSPLVQRSAGPVGGATLSQLDLCTAWKSYFGVQATHDPVRIQHAYWNAHMKALRYAFEQYRDEIQHFAAPQPELDYWKGYVRLIEIFSSSNGPTNDALNDPFFKYTLPPCYPLGAPDCQVDKLPRLSRLYTKMIIALGNESCDHDFRTSCTSLIERLLPDNRLTRGLYGASIGAVGGLEKGEQLYESVAGFLKTKPWLMGTAKPCAPSP